MKIYLGAKTDFVSFFIYYNYYFGDAPTTRKMILLIEVKVDLKNLHGIVISMQKIILNCKRVSQSYVNNFKNLQFFPYLEIVKNVRFSFHFISILNDFFRS